MHASAFDSNRLIPLSDAYLTKKNTDKYDRVQDSLRSNTSSNGLSV